MSEKSKAHLPLVLGGLLLTVGLGLISVHVPFGRDQGVAAYVAKVMADHGAIYREVYHFNLPGIFFTYYPVSGLPIPEGVNLLHLLFTAMTYIAIYLAARRTLSPLAASFAALFYGLFATLVYTDYWDIAQKDSLGALPLALSLYFSLRAQGKESPDGSLSPLHAGLAGLFAGLAAMYKPPLGIVLFVPLILAWRARKNAKPWKPIASSLIGFGLAFIPLAAYLLVTGTFGDMIDSALRFGGFYGGQYYHGFFGSLRDTIWNLLKWAYEWRFLTALALAGAWFGLKDRGLRTVMLFGFLLLVEVVVQMKFFTYHWIPLLIPATILAAAGAKEIIARTGAARSAVLVVLVALLLGNLLPHAVRYKREMLYDLGKIDDVEFLRAYGQWGKGDICPLAQKAAAEYIKKHTAPEDSVLVFGHELAFYLLAERFPPTRFAYDQPLVTDPKGNAAFTAYREELRREFLHDLEEDMPAYIVVIEQDATGIEPEDSYTQMQSFGPFKNIIDDVYVLETKIEHYYIFRRLEPGLEEK